MISTLSDFSKKLGGYTAASKKIGVKRQLVEMTVKRGTPVFVEHDENLNVINCYLKKQWGNINGHFNT